MKLKEKLKNYKKVLAAVGSSTVVIFTSSMTAFADVSNALETAKGKVVDQVKPAVNNAAVPIILVILVGALVFSITRAVINYRKGRDVELAPIVAILIGIVLVGSFSAWGWLTAGV